ncbi:putative diguanylate cyclase YegE [mine drainage metagenome]|uniref:histidine kinase n=1 Tax=mine drainage metagenome TaxID=410659 RepID=A0A1J5RT67_9ZZZZ
MKPSSEQPLNTSADAPAARGFSLPVPGGSFATGWLAFVFAYGVALIVSESLRPPTALCSPVWLPAGLLVAVLVSASERRRPLILGTAAVLGFLYALGKRDGVTPALLETFGGILEAVAAVVLAGLWQGRRGSGSRGGAIGLLAISALPGPALGAALIASAHLLSPGSGGYLSTWLALWCRDVLSILLIVPLAMGAVSERRSWMDLTFRVRRLEAALLAVLAAASAWIVFSLIRVAGTEVKFLAVPIFVWAAMRFQARGVALAGALVSLIVFGLATWDPGAAGAFAPGLIELLQVFFVVAVATALMISIAWTEYQSSAGRLMRLRDAMAEIVVTLEVMRDASGAVEDFLVVDANPAFRTASGRQEPAASAVRLSAFIENPGLAYGREAEALLRDRRPRRLEVRSSRSGRWYQVSAYVPEDRDRIVAVATDITPVKEREAEVLRLSRRYEIVSDVNQAIVRSASREDMLRQVCAALVREGRFEVAWSGRFRGTEDRLVRVASAGDESLLADLRALGPEAEGMLARRAFEVGGVVACSRTGDDPTVRPWGPVAARHGIVAVAAFPLREDGRVIGAVAVGTGDGQDFCREEIGLLEQVSQDVGYALDKIRSDELGAQTVANLLESDRRFRGLFEQAPIAYQALDVRGVIVDVNPAWLALFRATRPESIGRPFMDFMPDEHRPDFIRGFSALVSGGGERAFEMALAREDGDPFSAHVTIRAQGDRAGGFQVAHCVIHDISERLRYERSLREGEERIKTAFEIANDGIWEADLRTGKLTLSSRFYTMLGYEPGAFDETPREWIDRIHPDDVARIVGRYPDFLASAEDSFEIEYRLRDRGGAWRWIMARGRVVEKGPAGEKARILGTNSDITARKQSELALRQSERRLALVIEGSALAAWDWDLHSNEILFNAYWARLTGNGDAERILSAQEWRTLIHTQDLPAVRLAFEDHLAGVQPHFECEYRVRKGDGNWVWVYDRGQVIARDGSGGPLRAAGTLRDITDRRLAEKQVREQAALLDQTQDIVIATDTAGRVRFANRSAEVFFGPSEEGLHDRRLADLFEGSEPVFDGAAIERVVADREWATEVRLEKGFLKGRILDARWSVVHSDAESPERLLLVCTDITDRRLLEARFLRAQRMESIGSLASGVAHDLNNIFLPISLAAHILKKSPPRTSAPRSMRCSTRARSGGPISSSSC